jgi:butyrate kinase
MDKLNAIPTSPSARNGRGERVLVINPGSTSTKIGVYEDETPLLVRNIRHTVEELSAFPQVIDQFEFRKSLVLRELEEEKQNSFPVRCCHWTRRFGEAYSRWSL